MWNYRLIRIDPDSVGVCEVYYHEDGTAFAYTDPVCVIAESKEEAISTLRVMITDVIAQPEFDVTTIVESDSVQIDDERVDVWPAWDDDTEEIDTGVVVDESSLPRLSLTLDVGGERFGVTDEINRLREENRALRAERDLLLARLS